MLEVTGIRGGYGAQDEIVKGVDLRVNAGEVVVIVGPNGAGKSTFLKLVAGLVSYRAGQVSVGGVVLRPGDPRSAINAHVGLVLQEANVFPSLTIHENLEMGALLDRKRARARIAEQYERFPMLKTKSRDAARGLSGGQRQILALALTLVMGPRCLLLDEPTAGLSPAASTMFFETVRELARGGMAILMIEQNAMAALEHADRGVVLVSGVKKQEGTAAKLINDPETRRLFLGGY